MVNTFHSDVQFRRIIYRDARNWTRKLSANSNGHNVWLRCMYEAHYISGCSTMNNETSWEIQVVIPFHLDVRFRRIICRDARNWTQKLSAYLNGHDFWLGCMYKAHDISGHSTMNNGNSWEIQMVITFDSDVLFRCIIYKGARNWTLKLSANSNDDNCLLGHMCESLDVSRGSKMNNESSR